MDTRIALKTGTVLKFSGYDHSTAVYTIQNEIGRGASCIVYDASYTNNAGNVKNVRIKECYPFKLRIARMHAGALAADESDKAAFEECKKRMYDAFHIHNELFHTDGLTNSIANTIDIYAENNTLYVVLTYLQGKTLSAAAIPSLRKSILIIKSTAAAIQRIHDRGYLYLDAKPQNIFVIDGTTDIVQLFDFDSIVPIGGYDRSEKKNHYRISYTEGFAALEQQMGKFKKLGVYTDVYGVGALLFYLLFGRTPGAPDCETDAVYDFSVWRFAKEAFQDKIYWMLTEFFHATLANYYADRYQSMRFVISKLEEMEKYADTTIPYMISSHMYGTALLAGRDEELAKIDEWFGQNKTNCLFLTGMGGIGKSTLVRSYIEKNRCKFDTVLYLYDCGSVKEMIADDRQLRMNTVERTEEESISDYFYRKYKMIQKLTSETRVLLVIDNYDGRTDEDFHYILEAGWEVIVITRFCISAQFHSLHLEAISDRKHLYELFEYYAQRKIMRHEYACLDTMIDKVAGHTLALELTARQIANSYLSVEEASKLLTQHGFSQMAAEKVEYFKDDKQYYDTIGHIMSALFDAGRLCAQKKKILKMLSFFSMPEMDIHMLDQLLMLRTKDDMNELKKDGWISIEKKTVLIHPVIRESILRWAWTAEFQTAALQAMDTVRIQLKLESHKKENHKKEDHKNEKLSLWLQLAENVLTGCNGEPSLTESDKYKKLAYQTLICMPRDKETYILKQADILLREPAGFSSRAVLRLYDMVVSVYEENGDLAAAYDKIMQAQEFVHRCQDDAITGQYYFMLVGFYDAKMDGAYDCGAAYEDVRKSDVQKYDMQESDVQESDVQKSKKAIDQAIYYMKRTNMADTKNLLVKYMLSKAMLIIRSGYGSKRELKRLFHLIYKLVRELPCDSEERGWYDKVAAWYYTLVEPDYNKAERFLNQSFEIEKKFVEGLDIIDEIIIPYANIYIEWKKCIKSASIIKSGIKICEAYDGVIPYIRKKMDLYGCLLDICYVAGDFSECRKIIAYIDDANKANRDIGIKKEIPPQLRKEILQSCTHKTGCKK